MVNLAEPASSGPQTQQPRVSNLDWVYQQSFRLIEQHVDDSRLSVRFLLAQLPCSRPTLYRAFASRNQTVAGAIRAVRVRHFCKVLAAQPHTIPIETLAYRCGFNDVRTFNRSFRRELGISAGEFRARLRQIGPRP